MLTRRAVLGFLALLPALPQLRWPSAPAAASLAGATPTVLRHGVGDYTVFWRTLKPGEGYPVIMEAGRQTGYVKSSTRRDVRIGIVDHASGQPVDAPFIVAAPDEIARGGA